MFKIKKYEVRPELFYHPQEHFWLKVEGNRARIGMEPLEQESRGAFVVVQIDAAGKALKKSDSFGSVEAEKYVGMLRAPVSGEVVNINEKVQKNPRLVNTDPYGEGWLIEIELSNFGEEKEEFITGEGPLKEWYESEIKRYEELGWLAE